MGFLKKARRMMGGDDSKFECHQDQAGKVKCRSFREFEDGTRQELAGIDFEFGSDCKKIATDMFENEDGELEKLEKKAVGKIIEKCRTKQNQPSDY